MSHLTRRGLLIGGAGVAAVALQPEIAHATTPTTPTSTRTVPFTLNATVLDGGEQVTSLTLDTSDFGMIDPASLTTGTFKVHAKATSPIPVIPPDLIFSEYDLDRAVTGARLEHGKIILDLATTDGVTGGGTFTNLNVEAGTSGFPTPTGDGDLPVSDVVRDDASHTLYVSTDFGVLRGDKDGTGGWHVTAGMPRYEVVHLEIQPSSRVPTCAVGKKCQRVLYAATHSQGIWRMNLGGK